MKPNEVIGALRRFGLKLDSLGRSRSCMDAFCTMMEPCRYGDEETATAFRWFEAGWQAAQARLK